MDNVIPVDGVKKAMGLDFHAANDMIYWTDIQSKTISRAHINGTSQQTIATTNLGKCSYIKGNI